MTKPNLFFKLTKVDEAQRTVEGIATAEAIDKAGEVCDYEGTKPYYQKWSDSIKKASGGKSLGNVRAMHSNIAAGKITEIIFDDVAKAISIVAKIVDDAEWKKVLEGVYTGFSQGGEYIKRWAEKIDGVDVMKYIADPSEVSIVDNPCLGLATFSVVKADGIVEQHEFKKIEAPAEDKLEKSVIGGQVWQANDGTVFKTKAEMNKRNIEIEAEAEAKKAVANAMQALADAEEKLGKGEGEEDDAAKACSGKKDDKEKKKKEEAKKAVLATLQKYEGQEVWDAAAAIEALGAVQQVLDWELWEQAGGEDEAAQVAMLRASIAKLKEFIASELAEDHSETEAEKAAKATLAKAADDRLEKAEALNKSLLKSIEGMQGVIENLTKRIDTIERAPAPRKGSLFAVDRVEKGHESPTGETVEAKTPNLTTLRLSPEEMRKVTGF